jgi:bloom syndrome protein
MFGERIKELKAAISARTASPSAGNSGARGISSSGSNAPLRPQLMYHTPEPSDTGSRRTTAPNLNRMSSSSHLASDDHQQHIRSQRPVQPLTKKTIPTQMIPDESDFDDDIAMAEAMDNMVSSRAPASPSPKAQGASRRRQALQDENYMAALAEMEDLPVDAIFSSPTAPPPSRPIRIEASAARSAMGGPGPSTQQAQIARAQAIREAPPPPVQLVKKYAWTKEVEKKLRDIFKLPGFRHHQREAIDATMAGRDGGFHISITMLKFSVCPDADWRREKSHL